MPAAESQNTEWKESWNDDYLRWVCGFANAYGGCICIGKNDRGETVGLSAKECRKLCEDIPNKVRDTMGVMVDVNLREECGKRFVEIQVPPVTYPVNYRGEYHYRSGSTKQRLIGAALTHFLLRKTGLRWDAVPVDGVTPAELDEESFALFREKALSTHRMSPEDWALSRTELLDKLNLLENGQLKRAALLLFHRRPERWFTGAWVKIGFFESHAEIAYQDELHGSLMMLAERVIDLLYTKYMRAPITYEGVTRVERYPFPKDAVREALYNALIHADYSAGVPIQISVYEDKLYIFNKAQLEPEWTEAKFWGKHGSNPLNPSLAGAFFRAGYVESWGRGIEKMSAECSRVGVAAPTYDLTGRDVMICFERQETVQPIPAPVPQAYELTERQRNVLKYLRVRPRASYEDLADYCRVSRRTISTEISRMVEINYLERVGADKKGSWIVKWQGNE